MSKLNDAQFLFSECLGKLLQEIERRGWKCSVGDVWAVDLRSAIDFLDGVAKHTDFASSTKDVALLIASDLEKRKHSSTSNHYGKLAVDVNLFKPEILNPPMGAPRFEESKHTVWHYCTLTSDHAELGAFWKGLHPACEWGGDWESGDANHYQVNKEKV